MNLQALKCPRCGGALEIENGLDIFYCKYCGYKIVLSEISDASINAKVHVKEMEHKEKLQDKEYAQERYKMEFKQKDDKHTAAIVFGIFGAVMLLCLSGLLIGNLSAKKQEEKLQNLLKEIMVDIEKCNFDEAYIKANSLYWDDSWTSEGEDKWNSTREAILEKIKEAEKEQKGIDNDNDDGNEDEGFFNWFNWFD